MDWAKMSGDGRHSPGFQEAQGPAAVGALQTKVGPLQCHRWGLCAMEAWPLTGALLTLRHCGLGGPTKGQRLTVEVLFQIILISFPLPFVLSLYHLNQL